MITIIRNLIVCIEDGALENNLEGGRISPIQRIDHGFSLTFSCKDISFITGALVMLNIIDVLLSFYAHNVLGFMELNPLAIGFPILIFILKFGVCFIPFVCAYVLDKFGMKNYLLLPFVCSVILVEFYAFVVALNMSNILGV
jgi:hypothetical protein